MSRPRAHARWYLFVLWRFTLQTNGWSVFDILSGGRAEGRSLRHASPRSAYYCTRYRLLLASKCVSTLQLAAAACFPAVTPVVKFAGLLMAGELAAHDRARAAGQERMP